LSDEPFFFKIPRSCPDNSIIAAYFLAIMTSLAEKIPQNITQFNRFNKGQFRDFVLLTDYDVF
jgi:hypothetical protein